jgi:hypothetical protein
MPQDPLPVAVKRIVYNEALLRQKLEPRSFREYEN